MKFSVVPVLAVLIVSLGAGAQQTPAVSAAGEVALTAHRDAIARSALIYGYNLKAGGWAIHQLPCTAMLGTVMLRYTRRFPGGAESLFTVLAPRGAGSVSMVPVLYAGRTPFTPAPGNPRNVALFNRLVAVSGTRRGLASRSQWQELGACYAYMTGANALAAPGRSIGVAGAPTPFLHAGARGKGTTVTFADRDSFGAYRLWSLRFDAHGRMTAASVRDYVVSSAKPHLGNRPHLEHKARSAKRLVTATKTPLPKQPETVAALPPSGTVPTSSNPADERAGGQSVGSADRVQTGEQGWKPIRNPPQPPSKFIPSAPQPPSKFIPNPPDPSGK